MGSEAALAQTGAEPTPYEVWSLDQSDSRADGGGTLYIYNMHFNHANTHAIVAYVATGHVLFLEAATRKPVGCIDVGTQAHEAHPSPDGTVAIVANQNGKLLQRILTDYTSNTFRLDEAATLNLASGTTPSGAPIEDPVLRPDNALICPILDSTDRFAFVTLRGGGMLVVDCRATPMRIVAEYDRTTVHPNGDRQRGKRVSTRRRAEQ